MSFDMTRAYVGPYCYSLVKARHGESRQFRFAIQGDFREQFGDAQMIVDGRITATWSTGNPSGAEIGIGSGFEFDSNIRPLPAVDETLSLNAQSDCAVVCVVASGTDQRIVIKRHKLAVNETVAVDRYSLAVVAGNDALIRIDGEEEKRGYRLIYASSGALKISAVTQCTIGVLSLQD